jgi:hypothetical protein
VGRGVYVAVGGNHMVVGVVVVVGGSGVSVGSGDSGATRGTHAALARHAIMTATTAIFMYLVYYEMARQDGIVL